MTKTEFMYGINLIQDNYNKVFTDSQLKLFYDNLYSMDKEVYIANIKNHIRTSKFMPCIADILGAKTVMRNYAGYEQRDYSNFDFDQLYANELYRNKKEAVS